MTKSHETVVNGEGLNLNLHKNHTLVHCPLPDKLPYWLPPNPIIFLLFLAEDGI